jgi:lipopolysaccharide transport system ATP-binding protein
MGYIENKIIEFSELNELIDMPVKYYSSGMFGRLAFSIATMITPEILLVDELFSTGDAHFVTKASNQMLKIMDSSQLVVFVSHNLEQIVNLCNKVVVMDKGIIVNQGEPEKMAKYYLENIISDE